MQRPEPESTSNSGRSPKRWQDAAETAFHKVYNAKDCVSPYSFRKVGDTLEREGWSEGDKAAMEAVRGRGAKAPVISQITGLDALTCLETWSYYFKFWGSGTYKQWAGDCVAAGGREGRVVVVRDGPSRSVDIWCENWICSSPVIGTQFPVSHARAGRAFVDSHCPGE